MGRLIGELTGRLGDRIRTGVEVTGIQRSDDGWVVCGSDGTTMGADAVVVTTPAHVAATLVAPHAPEAASALGGLRHASVVVATMAWRRADLEVPEDQSGFLVGRGEGLLMTACSFAGSKWAHLDDPDHTILRVSCGRIDDERHDALDDPGLAAALSADVATTLGVQARPVVARLTRWPRSLVQFPIGHPDLMAEVDSALAASPGLVVTGAARHGVGIPACVRSGTETAAEVADLVG
jgi:oxygen-dependent protoporphyrinogen oxidase